MKALNNIKEEVWAVSFFAITILSSFSSYRMVSGFLMLALFFWIYTPSIKNHVLKRYALTPYVLLSVVWMVVVLLMSEVPFFAFKGFNFLVALPLMYLVATESKKFDFVWGVLKQLFILLAVVFASWGIYDVVFEIGRGYSEGPFNDRNAFACMMNLFWFLIVWQVFVHTNKQGKEASSSVKQTILIASLFLVTLSLFVSSSRGAIIAWGLFSPIMLFFGYRHTQNRSQLFAILMVVIIAYVASNIMFTSNISGRTFELAQDQSTFARLKLWVSTFYMAIDHPIWGVGWNNFQFFYPEYRYLNEQGTSGIFTHNDYLQLAAEGGVLALSLIGAFFLFVFWMLWQIIARSIKPKDHHKFGQFLKLALNKEQTLEVIALLLGVSAVLIHAGVNFIFYYAGINMVLGIYLARIAVLSEVTRKISIPKFDMIRPAIKSTMFKLLLLVAFSPFLINAVLYYTLVKNKTLLEPLPTVNNTLNNFDLAGLTANIFPYNIHAQNYLMKAYETILIQPTLASETNDDQRERLLLSAVQDFDRIRANNHSATLNAMEVRLILGNLDLDKTRLLLREKAHDILNQSLKMNPLHAESYVLKARLLVRDGLIDKANQVLQYGLNHSLHLHDQLLIQLQFFLQNKQLTETMREEIDIVEYELLEIRNYVERAQGVDNVASLYQKAKALVSRLEQLADIE